MDLGNFITFGHLDRRKAKNIIENATAKQDEYIEELKEEEEQKNIDLEELGFLKKEIYETEIYEFAIYYKKIGEIKVNNFYLDEVTKKELDHSVYEVQEVVTHFQEIGGVIGGSAVAGATLAYGAFGVAGLVGTASTGTAIGTLSGAVATKASLAWLGGGALSVGGAGMTGGILVLGGIAIAPLAVVGMLFGVNKGKKALNEAENYADSIEVIVEKMKTAIFELSTIRRSIFIVSNTLKPLKILLAQYNFELNKIIQRLDNRNFIAKFIIDPIKSRFFNIDILTNKEMELFLDASNIFEAIRKISNIPIIDENGAFLSISIETVNNEISLLTDKTSGRIDVFR